MEQNTVRVSSRRIYTLYVYEVKEKLKTSSQVELHGLGEAITNTVRAAEMLCSLGYATMEKFITLTVTENTDSDTDRSARKSKVVISLKKTSEFDRLYEEYEKTRATKTPRTLS
jgi:hypothetical protein